MKSAKTRPTRWAGPALVAALAAALLAGCSDDAPQESDGPALVAMPVSKSVLMVGGPLEEPDDEVLKGKPVFVNGCLGVQSGEKTYLVVWPSGTNVAGPDSDAIRIGDQVLEPGQSFAGRGTYVLGKPFPVQFPEVPITCLGPSEENIMWVQEITEVTD